jgi:regulator of protease activity HflC (stomatin/prohibitin superfamily)
VIQKYIKQGGIALVGIILVFSSFTTVENGHVGLRKTLGSVSPTILEPGLHFKFPLISSVMEINVQVAKTQSNAAASSKDLQPIHSEIAVNYTINQSAAYKLITKVGADYDSKVIQPHVQEIFKEVTAKYSAEELISKRDLVASETTSLLRNKLSKYYINVKDISIVNFGFSKAFNDSIEQKQIAAQNAIKAQNELQKAKIDAQQKVVQAQAEADATKARADADMYAALQIAKGNNQLSKSMTPTVVNYEFVKKWDGKLPATWGNGNLVNVLPATK